MLSNGTTYMAMYVLDCLKQIPGMWPVLALMRVGGLKHPSSQTDNAIGSENSPSKV